jgi:hypothetical protein
VDLQPCQTFGLCWSSLGSVSTHSPILHSWYTGLHVLAFHVVEGKPHGALGPAALNCGGSHELQDLPVLSSGYLLDPDLEERVFCRDWQMASPCASQLTNRPFWPR